MDLLMEVIPLLKDIKIEYPTDVFFFDVIPVTPPSMRPVSCSFVWAAFVDFIVFDRWPLFVTWYVRVYKISHTRTSSTAL